jgi:Fur family ferric uptake transcriptional regulator
LGYPEGVDKGRNRRNREALLEAARSIKHAFSAHELHAAAKEREPAIGLSTAYRALDRWRRDGTIEDAGSREGEAVYLMCSVDGHHHHLVCGTCGSVSTLDGCALTSVRDAARSVGFQLNDEALSSLPGRCAQCAVA